jgi:hypothetical protein
MFNKNKKMDTRTSVFNYCQEMFDAEKNKSQDDLDFNSAKKLYVDLKKYYLEKIKQDDKFINIERIRLQQELGNYTRDFVNTNITFYITFLSALGALLLQDIGLFDKIKITSFTEEINSSLSLFLKIIAFFAILGYLTYQMNFDKSSKTEKRKTILNNIKLKVLEDIEKEINTVAGKNTVNSEVAAAVQQEERSRDQVRHTSNQTNGNWNVEISTLSIIDTLVGIYGIGKFAKRLFKKKK